MLKITQGCLYLVVLVFRIDCVKSCQLLVLSSILVSRKLQNYWPVHNIIYNNSLMIEFWINYLIAFVIDKWYKWYHCNILAEGIPTSISTYTIMIQNMNISFDKYYIMY